MAVLQCYVCFNKLDAQKIKERGVVDVAAFGSKDYIKLSTTPEQAVQIALRQNTKAAAEAAMIDTEWYLLEVTFDQKAIAFGFVSQKLQWSPGMRDIQWYAPIPTGGQVAPDITLLLWWTHINIAAAGLHAWANRVVHETFGRNGEANATCKGCGGVHVFVWYATRKCYNLEYCAKCWHRAILSGE